jgi:lysine-ketoglutarate reductase/saccharopine dehydrogenase-like protein (TIGR00300 family)
MPITMQQEVPALASETVVLEGHIIDSLTLSRVLDTVLVLDGSYDVANFRMGRTKGEPSRAEITVTAADASTLERILHEIGQLGAVRVGQAPITTAPAPADGVFPDGFYSTTNLETDVYAGGAWVPVSDIEMDCGIVVRDDGHGCQARCVPIGRIAQGDAVVVGDAGVRVHPLPRIEPSSAFHFMGSGVSSERRKEIVVAAVARAMRETREEGRAILLVGGPAIIHTGAGKYLEALIEAGWVDVLFAGNALATHDIEHALYGTSLGVDMRTGLAAAHGHEHHLRAINAIRAAGSIARAVEAGILTRGVMHACVRRGVRYVLAGSIRDDGPLPEVITDTVAAQDAMREAVRAVGIAVMVATTLHSVATGNLLPATVTTICVDNAADTVIKLMDRGTHQAFGLVTDCEFFLKELAARVLDRPA